MARPRKYIQIGNKTIDGVHLHRASGRYYIIDHRRKQVSFRDLQAASDAYRREQSDPVAVAKENAEYALRRPATRQPEFFARLAEMLRRAEGARVQLGCSDPENRIRSAEGNYARDGQSIAPFADACGAPRYKVAEVGSDTVDPMISSAINPTLKRVGEAWLQAKLVEAGLSDKKDATTHIETTIRLWKVFVRRVGIWMPEVRSDPRYSLVFVPLWLPLLVFGLATALLWRRDRRPLPGHCQSCGYDLTGNVSGRCPECGNTKNVR